MFIFAYIIKQLKTNKMGIVKLTSEQYLKAIKLGYYEQVQCVTVFIKIVKHYKVCGRTERLIIEIKNK